MGENPPVIYVLNGEDESAITQFTASLMAKLGDSAMAELNTSRLDGRTVSLEELEASAASMPFLVKRRLVILMHPIARISTPAVRTKFLKLLERLPASVALVLVEVQLLTPEKEWNKGTRHWLEKWAEKQEGRVYMRRFPAPQGEAMARRIQERAKAAGGQFTHQGAFMLASLVGDNTLIADQEVNKLLAYVNFARPVAPEDVELLTAEHGQVDIFAMVDAIATLNGREAINLFHRLLREQDFFSIFGMVVRQFRLLILSREFIESGGKAADAARVLKLHPYVAKKVYLQANKFTLSDLEKIYSHLLDIDSAVKVGETDGVLALDALIASLTTSLVSNSS
jgi:DNA polymerase III subunit delta